MAKISGYEVTIKAFLPCDVHVRGSVATADDALDAIVTELRQTSLVAVKEARIYRQRADVPDAPANDPTPAAQPLVQPSNADPEMPEVLRRKPA